MKMKTRRNHEGFTLIELLLVLVILAVLAAVVVPKFANCSELARQTAAKTDIRTIEGSLEAFEVDNGRYPTGEEGLGALMAAPSGLQNWHGPYIKGGGALPKDPWGNAYVYRYPGTNNANGFDLYSLGPDGRDGGDDIGNWTVQK